MSLRTPRIASFVVGLAVIMYPTSALATGPQAQGAATLAPELQRVVPPSDPLAVPQRPEQFQPQGPLPLTLQQARELGLTYNRSLLVARQSLLSARYSLRRTQAQLYPSLTAQAGLNTGLSSSEALAYAAEGRAAPSLSSNPSLQLSYDLGLDGGRAAQLDIARAQVEVAELEVHHQVLGLGQQVANSYYDLQAADEQLRIAKRDEDYAQRSLKDTEILQHAGVQTVFETQRAQVYEARTRAATVNAAAQQRVARRALSRLLGLAYDAEVLAAERVALTHAWSPSLPEAVARAMRTRPELAQARWQERAGEAQVRLAGSGRMPRVVVSGGADALLLPGFALGYTGGVNLSVPLFEGGAAQAGMDMARADQRGAALRLADTASQVQQQVTEAFAQMESSRANLDTTAVALRTAQASLVSARIRFQAGVGTQTDLIGAENDLSRADLDAINAVLSYNRAVAALEALTAP